MYLCAGYDRAPGMNGSDGDIGESGETGDMGRKGIPGIKVSSLKMDIIVGAVVARPVHVYPGKVWNTCLTCAYFHREGK